MFKQFFGATNKPQRNSCSEIVLKEKQQNQKHTLVFDAKQDIEYFSIKQFATNIESVKTCDYVIINHTDKKILFCELKNAKDKKEATKQLWHSKNIVNCLIGILGEDIKYQQGYVVINKKSFNKGKTSKKLKTTTCKHFKYTYTGQMSISFNKLHYE